MTAAPQVISESNKFARDIIWVAMSQIFTSLLGIITLPVFTKTYTSEMYGIWTQVSVTVGLVVPLVTLHFGTAVVRFLAGEDDKADRLRSLGTMLCAILIFACLILIAANLWVSQISLFLFNDPIYTTFVRLTFLWIFADALFFFFISYLRARGKIKRLSIIQAVFSASKMGLIVILVLSGLDLVWIVASMVCMELIFVLGVLFMIIREEGVPILNFVGIKKFLSFSVPQIPGGVMIWIISASDRYFITHFLNLSQTGIYNSSVSLGGIVALFYSPIAFVLLPAVSKAWEQNRRGDVKSYFEYSTKLFLTLAVPAAIGLSILSQPTLKILATSDYLAGSLLVFLIAIGVIFSGIFMINDYIIYLTQQTKWEPLMIVAAAAISIGLNSVLISHIGILGAAISQIGSYFVLAAIVSVWANKTIKYSFGFRYLSKVVAASLIMALCLYFLKINNAKGIILAIIIGVPVFGISLFLLRGFSEQDKQLIKRTISGLKH